MEMNRPIDTPLQDLFQKLVLMGRLAQAMIALSLRGLTECGATHVDEIERKETEVDRLQVDIDALAVRITALHQPVGADIRFLFMAPRISEEFERIADHAMNMEHSMRSAALAGHPPLVDLRIMGEVAERMVGDVIAALIERDGAILSKIEKAEDEINAFRDRILNELTQSMSAGAITVPAALALIAISRSLERIGDHAISVGMEVAYIASGRDVRHMAAPA